MFVCLTVDEQLLLYLLKQLMLLIICVLYQCMYTLQRVQSLHSETERVQCNQIKMNALQLYLCAVIQMFQLCVHFPGVRLWVCLFLKAHFH